MTKIVLDLEWNQAQVGRPPIEDLPGEIIQIGAAKINDECNILDTFEQMIRPVFYTKMNKYVEDLTLIRNEDIAAGIPFLGAIEKFRNWCGENFVFISWAPDDIIMLEDNCRKFDYPIDWLPKSYDAQLMFDDFEMQEDRNWPLNYALYHFNEKPDGWHNALADVISTVAVLKHLDLKAGLEDDYFRTDSLPDDNEDIK